MVRAKSKRARSPGQLNASHDGQRIAGRDLFLEKGKTAALIAHKAIELFFRKGYMATTMRDIANACNITAGAPYNHYESKDALLLEIILTTQDEAERILAEALIRTASSPEQQLFTLMRTFVEFHCTYRAEALVANQNFRYLKEAHLSAVMSSRVRVRRMFENVLEHGHELGVFELPIVKGAPSARMAAIPLGDMGIRVAEWFTPKGSLSQGEVGNIYATLALKLLGCRGDFS